MTHEILNPSAPTPSSVDQQHPITFALILHTLYQGRRFIQIATLSAFLLATAIAFLLPRTYTSVARLIPPGSNNTNSGLSAIMNSAAILGTGVGKSQGDLYLGILKSRSVQSLLVSRFHLQAHYKTKTEIATENLLLKNSTFEVGVKDPIVTISVSDRNPTMARDLAEGYLRALQDTNSRLALSESSQRRAFFEQRLQREKDALADAEVAFRKSQQQTGLIAPAGQTSTKIQSLANLQGQITARQVQLASLLESETEDNPDVIGIRRQIQSLEAQASEMESGKNQKNFGQFSASQVPALELEYIRSARDVKYHETLFEIIAKQYEAARLDEAKEAPVQVLDQPSIPEIPSGPVRKLIMGIGLIAGFALSSAWILGREAFRPKE